MKSIASFFRRRGYGLFVTALVLALGLISWRLRAQDAPASAEQTAPEDTPRPTATAAPAATQTPAPHWLRPVSGGVLTEYCSALPAWNASMDCWQSHEGVDLSAAEGEDVRAAADGRVLCVAEDPLLGLTLQLAHDDGWVSSYAALDAALARPGDRVAAGDAIGRAGNSADSESLLGAHLHFALTRDGLPVKPAFE